MLTTSLALLPVFALQNWKFDPYDTSWPFVFPQGMASLALTCPFVAVLVPCCIVGT